MKPPLKRRVPKPRNPYVALAKQRMAGAHGPSGGAQRRAGKMALGKENLKDD